MPMQADSVTDVQDLQPPLSEKEEDYDEPFARECPQCCSFRSSEPKTERMPGHNPALTHEPLDIQMTDSAEQKQSRAISSASMFGKSLISKSAAMPQQQQTTKVCRIWPASQMLASAHYLAGKRKIVVLAWCYSLSSGGSNGPCGCLRLGAAPVSVSSCVLNQQSRICA